MKVFSANYLNGLIEGARSNSRLRQHRNVHDNYHEPCQRLFNAIEPGSYIQPHRHLSVPRDELLVAIRGLMLLIDFDDQGQIRNTLKFGSEKFGAEVAAGSEVTSDTWHTVVALEPGSVLLEVKAGPFDPGQQKDLAPWAPREFSSEAGLYMKDLMRRIQLA